MLAADSVTSRESVSFMLAAETEKPDIQCHRGEDSRQSRLEPVEAIDYGASFLIARYTGMQKVANKTSVYNAIVALFSA